MCLAALVLVSACADDPTALCSGREPVQLLASEDVLNLGAFRAGDFTFLFRVNEQGRFEGHAGRACGVEPVSLYEGIYLTPARLHEDPSDDDPTIACDPSSGHFFRVDPRVEAAPTLLQPGLDCNGIQRTAHGVVLFESFGDGLWLYPNFPADDSARLITPELDPSPGRQLPLIRDDELFYVRAGGELRIHDLATGADRSLVTGVAGFDVSATHVLWRGRTTAPVAPMRLLDRATGVSTYLGLDRDPGLDSGGLRRHAQLGEPWSLAPDGSHVLHVPRYGNGPMAAFDLTGAPLEFPAAGDVLHALADGRVIVTTPTGLLAVRPGEPPQALDVLAKDPHDIVSSPADDHLEYLDGDDLLHVPLDGSPSWRITYGVGNRWFWLDDEHLLTIHRDTLTTIEPGTRRRSELADSAFFGYFGLSVIPGDGVYYTVAGPPGDPQNGLWFMPEAGLRPAPPLCVNLDACD